MSFGIDFIGMSCNALPVVKRCSDSLPTKCRISMRLTLASKPLSVTVLGYRVLFNHYKSKALYFLVPLVSVHHKQHALRL